MTIIISGCPVDQSVFILYFGNIRMVISYCFISVFLKFHKFERNLILVTAWGYQLY